MKSEEEAGRAVEQYADLVRRICMIHLKNYEDSEDIFQTVFVTVNACRDLLKSFFRSRTVSLDQLIERPQDMPEDHSDILEAVLELPARFRDVVYLHYYEGYTAPEIGRILKKNPNTVYTLLARARQLLKTKLEGVIDDE